MSQWSPGPTKSFPCSIALSVHLRVKLAAGVLALAGANDVELGTAIQNSFNPVTYGSLPVNMGVLLRTAQGTAKFVANGAIAQGGNVYAAANGLVTGTPAAGGIFLGVALEAAVNNGDAIEVMRAAAPGLRVVSGQQTTVTASDTVVTGLNTVLSVVASLESNPSLTAAYVSAQVGNQTGAPVAGSVVINTWEPTSVSNPTPIAATSFGKIVNWIAVGY